MIEDLKEKGGTNKKKREGAAAKRPKSYRGENKDSSPAQSFLERRRRGQKVEVRVQGEQKAYPLNKGARGSSQKSVSPLNKIRKEIDQVDAEILALLERRFSLASRTIKYKTSIHHPEREREIIGKLKEQTARSRYLTLSFVRKMYRLIFNESLAWQKRQKPVAMPKKRPKKVTKKVG